MTNSNDKSEGDLTGLKTQEPELQETSNSEISSISQQLACFNEAKKFKDELTEEILTCLYRIQFLQSKTPKILEIIQQLGLPINSFFAWTIFALDDICQHAGNFVYASDALFTELNTEFSNFVSNITILHENTGKAATLADFEKQLLEKEKYGRNEIPLLTLVNSSKRLESLTNTLLKIWKEFKGVHDNKCIRITNEFMDASMIFDIPLMAEDLDKPSHFQGSGDSRNI